MQGARMPQDSGKVGAGNVAVEKPCKVGVVGHQQAGVEVLGELPIDVDPTVAGMHHRRRIEIETVQLNFEVLKSLSRLDPWLEVKIAPERVEAACAVGCRVAWPDAGDRSEV